MALNRIKNSNPSTLPPETPGEGPFMHEHQADILKWIRLADDVYRFRDSCNVYALIGDSGSVIIDAGTGAWLDHVEQLPKEPAALLCTHFFRDHAEGAAYAARAGLKIYVPEAELDIFVDPHMHHLQRETICSFDSVYWHHFAPIEPVAIAGVLKDHEILELAGLKLEVVPLPGATIGQIGVAFLSSELGSVLCSAETIHSEGRIPRIAPLQQVYVDLDGIAMVYGSVRALSLRKVDVLLPSLGEPILAGVDRCLSMLSANLRKAAGRRMNGGETVPLAFLLDAIDDTALVRISEHVYRTKSTKATTAFLVSQSGKVLSIDYGAPHHMLNYSILGRRSTRRGMLHSLDELEAITGRRGIDVVLTTHFHDDHVGGINLLKRVFGTKVWASKAYSEILEKPGDRLLPAAWPFPIAVDRVLEHDEVFRWEEFEFRMGPEIGGGHTHHQAVCSFVADGLTYAAVGDQYLSRKLWNPQPDHDWQDDEWDDVFCYRSGQTATGYRLSENWLIDLRPDVILNGHQPAIMTNDLVFQRVTEMSARFENLHRSLMPLDENDEHFGLDSTGAWIEPYRLHRLEPGQTCVRIRVRNPLPRAATLELRMSGAAVLVDKAVAVTCVGHEEAVFEATVLLPRTCRREPAALSMWAQGRPFGQVSEVLVTVGHARW
uniref:Carbofuran hydrolase n=7 Tax=root TaxID=1 RepID=Q9KJV0_9BURK|nr:carbofuran hydrolase [Achromobacter sp. WM111]QNH89817.1 carbofuran hydrolase [synthetic construct]